LVGCEHLLEVASAAPKATRTTETNRPMQAHQIELSREVTHLRTVPWGSVFFMAGPSPMENVTPPSVRPASLGGRSWCTRAVKPRAVRSSRSASAVVGARVWFWRVCGFRRVVCILCLFAVTNGNLIYAQTYPDTRTCVAGGRGPRPRAAPPPVGLPLESLQELLGLTRDGDAWRSGGWAVGWLVGVGWSWLRGWMAWWCGAKRCKNGHSKYEKTESSQRSSKW
jgi:hypothetical protein